MSFNNLFEEGGRIDRLKTAINARRSRHEATKRRNLLHKRIMGLIGKSGDPRTANRAVELYELWGDALDPAREAFVRSCLKEFETTSGHALISSASLMTLVMGAVSHDNKDRTVWCLEQNSHWTNVIRSWLDQYAIRGTYVIAAASTVSGGMVRYRIGTKHLPKNISMVVCDEVGASPGSTLSTLLSIAPHLAPEFTIFARKVRLDEDGPLLRRWAMKNDATFVAVNQRDGFIKISRREKQANHGRASYEVSEITAEEIPGEQQAVASGE